MTMTDVSTPRTSYCLNILYRIEMMQRVMNETLSLVNSNRNKLDEHLQHLFDRSDLKCKVECMELRVKCLKSELNARKERLEVALRKRSRQETDICEKGIDMLNKFQALKLEKESFADKRRKFDLSRERLIKTRAQLVIRRKQLIKELANIYPLVAFPDGKGGFSVCGVHLPNSEDFDGHDETMISVAIGYVSHMLVMLSRFLDVPLRYHINYYGSRSSIVDHLNEKISECDRSFPLHPKSGKDRMHFKYGVFLVNKNIAQLRHYLGLVTVDLRATLPNLYNLLREKLIFSDDLMSADECATSLMSASVSVSSFGQIDECLRREIEVMRNHHECQQQASSSKGVDSAQPRKLSTVSNNSLQSIKECDNKILSRSLDKGLNEIVIPRNSLYANDDSNSSSASSQPPMNSIPKHLSSNKIHYNLSEPDLDRLGNRMRNVKINNSFSTNHSNNWCQRTDDYLNNGTYEQSSTDSSPRVNAWDETPNISSVNQR